MALMLRVGGGGASTATAAATTVAIGVSSYPYLPRNAIHYLLNSYIMVNKIASGRKIISCSAVQESSTPTETKTPKKEAPAKPKSPAKEPAKPLPQLMEEDVIPSLQATLEVQTELSDIELSFRDNRLEGSFSKNGIPYSFWAFFPNGVLTGPKGFSLSSYGSEASTVEPFLIDEKKITEKHIVFWVEKRLAAQGIIPVWKD